MSTSDYWFQKYGGPEFWQRLSEGFYSKVTQHPELRGYFCTLRQERVREVAGDMWQVVLGFAGPACSEAIAVQHFPYSISEAHFRIYADMLKRELRKQGVEENDVEDIERELDSLKTSVCGQHAADE